MLRNMVGSRRQAAEEYVKWSQRATHAAEAAAAERAAALEAEGREATSEDFNDMDFCRELVRSCWEEYWEGDRTYAQHVPDFSISLLLKLHPRNCNDLSLAGCVELQNICRLFARHIDQDFLMAVTNDYVDIFVNRNYEVEAGLNVLD